MIAITWKYCTTKYNGTQQTGQLIHKELESTDTPNKWYINSCPILNIERYLSKVGQQSRIAVLNHHIHLMTEFHCRF